MHYLWGQIKRILDRIIMNRIIFKNMTSKLSQAGQLTSTEYAPTTVGASLSSVIRQRKIKAHKHCFHLIISHIQPDASLPKPPWQRVTDDTCDTCFLKLSYARGQENKKIKLKWNIWINHYRKQLSHLSSVTVTFGWQPGNLATLFRKPLTRGQEKR